jgi:hypothetical protein
MDLEIVFIFNGDKPKTYSKAECERDAKILFRSHIHRSHNSNQQFVFLKSINSKHSRDVRTSSKTYQMLEEQNSYSRDAFIVFFHSFINNYHQIKSKH